MLHIGGLASRVGFTQRGLLADTWMTRKPGKKLEKLQRRLSNLEERIAREIKNVIFLGSLKTWKQSESKK